MTGKDRCPFADGEPATERVCRLARDADRNRGVGLFRRLWRELHGTYDCPKFGQLPCEIFNGRGDAASFTEWRKYNGR